MFSPSSLAFAQQDDTSEINRSFEPEIEIQKEDYAAIRGKFRTNLPRKKIFAANDFGAGYIQEIYMCLKRESESLYSRLF